MTAFDPWDDPSATPPAFVPPAPEELAALDALLVEMKRDADALFEEVARNRDADVAQLVARAGSSRVHLLLAGDSAQIPCLPKHRGPPRPAE